MRMDRTTRIPRASDVTKQASNPGKHARRLVDRHVGQSGLARARTHARSQQHFEQATMARDQHIHPRLFTTRLPKHASPSNMKKKKPHLDGDQLLSSVQVAQVYARVFGWPARGISSVPSL